VSDERDGAGSAGDDTEAGNDTDTRGQTAVVTQPQRPTGKRSRREAESDATDADAPATEAGSGKNGDGAKRKAAKKSGPEKGRRNPFAFVWNYLKQVVAELRKVIWPNRKQMISYTTVVLAFLAFMVTLIAGVDLGVAKLVTMVFG
jgi:preprotein translocase subunit SecE